MTKEPIMIDDVDVSECKHLYTSIIPVGNDKIKCGLHQGKTCDNYPNCYYKQLKRKEQECEELKEENFTFEQLIKEIEKHGAIEEILQQLDQLKKELDFQKNMYESARQDEKDKFEEILELKEKYKWYDHYKESALRNKELYNDLSIKYDKLKAENEGLKKEIKHYKQTAQYQGNLSVKYTNKSAKLKQALQEIFKCLIRANRAGKLTADTLWIDNSTTLWDYFALTLGLEGDQLEIEEQILQKCDEVNE